jgi:hypothetical protein
MLKDYFHSPQWQRLIQRTCPDYDCNNQVCLASSSRMIPGRKQQIRYCATDDYDNCPIYLCKALRSSAPQGLFLILADGFAMPLLIRFKQTINGPITQTKVSRKDAKAQS